MTSIWEESGWGCSSDWFFQHIMDNLRGCSDWPFWVGRHNVPSLPAENKVTLCLLVLSVLEGQSSSAQVEGTKQLWCRWLHTVDPPYWNEKRDTKKQVREKENLLPLGLYFVFTMVLGGSFSSSHRMFLSIAASKAFPRPWPRGR